LFDPKDFHGLSVELLSKLPYTEALGRTAIGRGYYAAFLQAREKVNQVRPDLLRGIERRDIHWGVREALKVMGHPNISGKLGKLNWLRGKADYDLGIAIGELQASDALLLSEDIARLVGSV